MKENLCIQRSFSVVARLILLIILTSTIETSAQAPTWLWATSAGGTDGDYSNSISTDAGGNVFVTGHFFSPSITFGSTTLTNVSAGDPDIFVVKYDASGNVLWATSAGGIGFDYASGIFTDAGGNVVVTGHFQSPFITFGSYTLTNAGYRNFFVVKYDASGNVVWATSAVGTNDGGIGISTDTGGNVVVTGFFQSPSITFGSTTLTNAGLRNFFVVKYDASGNVLWATSAGGTGSDFGRGISTDAGGNVVVTGSFYSPSITFGSTTLTNGGPSFDDIFVVKYDASGNVLWATSTGGTGSDYGNGISTDASGNVVVTGSFSSPSITFGSTTLTNAGSGDIFVVKYDASGNVLWSTSAVGTIYDGGYGISTDAGGNVLVTGIFNSPSIAFGSTTLTNAGDYDIFVVKYSPSGNVLWATSAGGPYSDDGIGISTYAGGNVFVTGYFSSSSITFGTTTITNASVNNDDIFVAKLDNATGIEGNIKNDGVSIFPNPASSNLSISLGDNYKNILVTITDITGKLIYSNAAIETQKIEVSTKDFVEGIYFVKIQAENILETRILIITK